jgi:hypothetical protein
MMAGNIGMQQHFQQQQVPPMMQTPQQQQYSQQQRQNGQVGDVPRRQLNAQMLAEADPQVFSLLAL